MSAISIYLQDKTLRKLDAEVSRLAKEDKESGLSGRQIINRSKLIEKIIEDYLETTNSLNIENIRYEVVSLAEEYGAEKVSLFGSFARGAETETSDIDILLEKGKIKGIQVLDFQHDLSQRLGRTVDVVTTTGASERFLNKIKQDEVVLYEAS